MSSSNRTCEKTLLFFGIPASIRHSVRPCRSDGRVPCRPWPRGSRGILHVIVQNMKHTLGAAGFIGRWTEKHFLIIIPNCETRDLTRAAENVKRIVHSSGIQWWGDTLSVTVSLGQAVVQQGDSTESILLRAERALEGDASREPAQGKGSNLKGLGTSAS